MSMQSILAAGQSMSRMQTMQSVRTKMQGTENVLRIESKQDGGNEKKDARADALEEKSGDLMGELLNEVTDVNEALKAGGEVKTEKEQEEKHTEKDQRTDTLTLSEPSAGHKGALQTAQPVKSEAVTYDAYGSKAPIEPAKTAKAFEATA